MLSREFGRLVMIFTIILCLGGVTVASAMRGSTLADASSETTLVPRPTTSSSTTPRTTPTTAASEVLLPGEPTTTSTDTPATTAVADNDPYAWLETIPVKGQTFIGVTTRTGSIEEISEFETAAEKPADAVMISRDWENATPDIASVELLTANGQLPILAWEPWNHEIESSFNKRRGEQPEFALSTIIDGDHDELIDGWATELAEWGRPVAIRFAHEMNGFWYPWGESVNGNSAGQYVTAWRHVHDRFTEAGADNVIWIWSPNPVSPSMTPLDGLYPGDDYVDWVGVVGYLGNGIDPTVYVPTFDQLFGPTIDEIRELTDKPLVLTELGATEHGGKKASWLTHVLEIAGERDDIIGFIWFEVEKETDWRIVSSEESRQAFAESIAGDEFGIPR